jgi:hypothetical protein
MENRTKQAIKHYDDIMNGVVGWYNFKGRIGCWYNFNDGLDEIKALEEHFVKVEDYERAKDMKEQYDVLREYMIEEEILDAGVLPEYR